MTAFWEKARRVVMYKVKTEVDAKKKEVMDKQARLPFVDCFAFLPSPPRARPPACCSS